MCCALPRWSMPLFYLGALLLMVSGCSTDAEDDDDSAGGDDDSAGGDDDNADDSVRLLLHGGGTEDDAIFGPFVEAAGCGHIVTLGAVEDPEEYEYLLWWDDYFVSLGAASAETLNTESPADANNAAVTAALEAADGIFIRGGDQSRYLAHWMGTPLHDGLAEAWDRGAVIGGSSAGCAILGERIYDASVGGVAAYEALLDPYDPTITFTDGFLTALPGVITDTHFTERGRLGRLPVFLERWKLDGADAPLGIGVDPETALFIRGDGTAEVAGSGSVTLLDPGGADATLTAGRPPDIRGHRLWQLPAGYRLDLNATADGNPVLERPEYVGELTGGAALSGFPNMTLDGDDLGQRSVGDWQLTWLESDPDAWRNGDLRVVAGDGTLPGLLLVTALYEDSDTYENHLGGLAWAVAQHPETVVIGIDIYLEAEAIAPATLTAGEDSYLLVLDGRGMSHAGVPTTGWQTAALEGATLSVIGPGMLWDGGILPR